MFVPSLPFTQQNNVQSSQSMDSVTLDLRDTRTVFGGSWAFTVAGPRSSCGISSQLGPLSVNSLMSFTPAHKRVISLSTKAYIIAHGFSNLHGVQMKSSTQQKVSQLFQNCKYLPEISNSTTMTILTRDRKAVWKYS